MGKLNLMQALPVRVKRFGANESVYPPCYQAHECEADCQSLTDWFRTA